jgi:hypothetical protein
MRELQAALSRDGWEVVRAEYLRGLETEVREWTALGKRLKQEGQSDDQIEAVAAELVQIFKTVAPSRKADVSDHERHMARRLLKAAHPQPDAVREDEGEHDCYYRHVLSEIAARTDAALRLDYNLVDGGPQP